MRIKCLAQGHYCRCQQLRTGDLTIECPWPYAMSHNTSSNLFQNGAPASEKVLDWSVYEVFVDSQVFMFYWGFFHPNIIRQFSGSQAQPEGLRYNEVLSIFRLQIVAPESEKFSIGLSIRYLWTFFWFDAQIHKILPFVNNTKSWLWAYPDNLTPHQDKSPPYRYWSWWVVWLVCSGPGG